MAKGKGWFNQSKRHRLSALGIKTGRKLRRKTGILVNKDNSLFYPKKDTEDLTIDLPITAIKKAGEIATGKGDSK